MEKRTHHKVNTALAFATALGVGAIADAPLGPQRLSDQNHNEIVNWRNANSPVPTPSHASEISAEIIEESLPQNAVSTGEFETLTSGDVTVTRIAGKMNLIKELIG